ncbi:MAG: DUF2088 domain-containing protein, partial [Phycisphaerae bacterium]|nr:DUF2088 domain-containing protein [Phycisphaerae bacterium]
GPVIPDRAAAVDLAASIREALDLLHRKRKVTILVNDPQRGTATGQVLREVAKHIDAAGTRILVATGSHQIAAARRESFQRTLLAGLRLAPLEWHDCRSGELVRIGAEHTWHGHRWLLDTRAILAIGSVEPHYFAGYTGAHKTCTIGCASYEDIEANHAAAMGADCSPAKLAGNPVHEGIERMLAGLVASRGGPGKIAAINLVQAGERILAATAGGPIAALHAAIPAAGRIFCHNIEGTLDGIIAQVSSPLDRSFYQAEKAIKNNESAVRDGGIIVLVAACRDGIGQRAFTSLLGEAGDYAGAAQLVRRRGYRLGDHKGLRLRRLTDPACRAVRLFAVANGLSEVDANLLGITKADSEQAALAAAGLDPKRHRILRIQDAANMVVFDRSAPQR